MNNATANRIGRGNLGRIARLTRKELRETLRDRRTVITLVLMPLLVYPLISISFNKSVLLTAEQTAQIVYSIGVSTPEHAQVLAGFLVRGERLLQAQRSEGESPHTATGAGTAHLLSKAESWEIFTLADASLESQVADLNVHMAVRLRPLTTPSGNRRSTVECQLLYQDSSPASQRAMRIVEDRLRAVNDATLRARLARAGLPAELPATVTLKGVATSGRTAPFSLATLVPLVLILMTITGAVYPAIDLTAGERERGTLETLIAAPISRVALLIAKYVAVLTVAVLTALVNLVAMTITILSSSLHEQLFPEGLSITLMAEIFGLMVLFAAFFSAIMLAVTSFARSFKEAQAYLIPVMLLAISPGLLSLMPGLQLSGLLAVTPLVNIVLLSRDLLENSISPAMAALAIASTAIYALVAIGLASKVFGNDALLYASRGSWSDLFYRPATHRSAPTAPAALACLAAIFPCFFLLGNLATRYAGNVSTRLLVHAAVSVIVFGMVPLLFAAAQRVRIPAGFQLRPAPLLAFVGAVVLGGSLWPFAYELFMVGKLTGLVSLERGQLGEIERLLQAFQGLSPVVVLLTLSVIQPVCEEFFFRGYLFHGLRDRYSGPHVVLISSLLFGMFHVLNPTLLTPERFLPTTFLGLFLGWVCYRTGSVLPGMMLHMLHNGLLLMVIQNRDAIMARGWDFLGREHLPTTLLVGAALVTVVGTLLVYLGTRRQRPAAIGQSSAEQVR
ncbi:MAG: ABC transporter permease subunit/CPBP intramembrane protease [Pirellulaceae bacterium]